MELTEPALILRGGFLVARGAIARFEDEGAFPWIAQLLAHPHRFRFPTANATR